MARLLQRLKNRKLVQWALAYIAFAFALMQGVDIVAQRFDWPDQIERILILALAIGFLFAIVLAWYHGERGAQRVGGTEIVILALLLAVGGGLLWHFGKAGSAADAAKLTTARSGKQAVDARVSASAATSASPVAKSTRSPTVAREPAPVIPAKSVAVLPFVNESGNKDQQYFSDGLSDDLITALAQLPALKVINRESSFRFRDSHVSIKVIAGELGVAHLLEGTVQRAGGEVRISAQLVNASDGSIVWSQRYDEPYKDLFKLQDSITKAVADALKSKLLAATATQSDRPPGGSLTAWTDFQQGRFYAQRDTRADQRKAIGFLRSAVHIDPKYALAWAHLASSWADIAGNFATGDEASRSWDKARAAVRTALRLDPDQALAYSVRSYMLSSLDHDWTGAEAAAQRAYQLAPNEYFQNLATIRATLGQPRQAVELIGQGLVTNPLCVDCYLPLVLALPSTGRLNEAAAAARKALQLRPDENFIRMELVKVDVMRGDAAAALADARQAPSGMWRTISLAFALQIGGDRAAADAALEAAIDKLAGVAAYQIAEIYALRRDPDGMFKWLQRAARNRDPGVSELLYDVPMQRYRNDPRFAAFRKQVGLPGPPPPVGAVPPAAASGAGSE
jgi:TolB-like protein/Tfp pilus assembly protein PilF